MSGRTVSRSLARAMRWLAGMLLAMPFASVAVAQSSPSAYTWATRYDVMRRVVGTIAPDPDGTGSLHYAAVRNSYDVDGRLVKVETGELATWQPEAVAPSAWTGFTIFKTLDGGYDLMDRKTSDTLSSGGTVYAFTEFSYDAVGRPLCTAVRMDATKFTPATDPSTICTPDTSPTGYGPDRVTRNVYDDAGQLIQVRKAVGTSIEQAYATYSYSPDGKPLDVIDANGNHSLMVYDGFDRLSQWQFPAKTPASAYDPSTQATALATANAVNPADLESYTYDANDNRLSLTKRGGQVIGYSYNALDRMIHKGGSTLADISYSYDAQGHQLTAIFSTSTLGITTEWDNAGRPTTNTDTTGGTSRKLSYQYDGDGDRIQVKHPDDSYFTTLYDGLDREMYIKDSTGNTRVHFFYDNQGRNTAVSRDNGLLTYRYFTDPSPDRLSSLRQALASDYVLTFAYNPDDQLTGRASGNDAYAWRGAVAANRAYGVNGLNQYAAAGPYAQSYDANGNLTSDGSTTYGYDSENRLVSATGGHTATLTYDPLGRLASVTGAATTRFLYDGDELVAEYDGAGTLLRRYVHGTVEDDPLLWYEGTGLTDPRFLHTDEQGSIVAISTEAGATLGIDSYDEYGVPGAANIGRFQYTGQAWLPEIGLYHYKARAYSPTLGRFLQTDPVGYSDNVNLYAYVGDDPVNRTDPTGNGPDWVDVAANAVDIVGTGIQIGSDVAAAGETVVSGGTALAGPAEITAIEGNEVGGILHGIAEGVRTAKANPDGHTITDSTGRVRSGSFKGPGQGRPISRSTRASERTASGNQCSYCGKPTVNEPGKMNSSVGDHIQPKAGDRAGGPKGDNSPANTANSCSSCNASKNNLPFWHWVLKEFGSARSD